jgi:hypothetical protein
VATLPSPLAATNIDHEYCGRKRTFDGRTRQTAVHSVLSTHVKIRPKTGPVFESGFWPPGKHAKRAPSLRLLIGSESVQRFFTGKTGFRGSTLPNGAGTHRARSREASSGPATLCEKGPRDRPSRGTTRRSASAGVGGGGRPVARGRAE